MPPKLINKLFSLSYVVHITLWIYILYCFLFSFCSIKWRVLKCENVIWCQWSNFFVIHTLFCTGVFFVVVVLYFWLLRGVKIKSLSKLNLNSEFHKAFRKSRKNACHLNIWSYTNKKNVLNMCINTWSVQSKIRFLMEKSPFW